MAYEEVMSSSEISDEHLFKARSETMPHAKSAPKTAAYLNELDCVRIARRLMAEARPTLGLLPLSALSNASDVSERLSRALGDQCRTNVALLRLHDDQTRHDFRETHAAELGVHVKGAWLDDSVALVIPAEPVSAGQGLAAMETLIRYAQARVPQVVVDLASLAENDMRQALAVCHFLSGVALLAVEGVTREAEILAVERELGERLMGAVLLSPTPEK